MSNHYKEFCIRLDEYRAKVKERQDIISSNRSRRMRGLSICSVPERPVAPVVYECYINSVYEGAVYHIDDVPVGMLFKETKPIGF